MTVVTITTNDSVVCHRSSSGQNSTTGTPATNAPMNSVLMKAPNPCARVCGGITACATGSTVAMAAATHANPAAASTIVVATVWVHHPTIAKSKPSNSAADRQTAGERRGHQRGQRDQREQQSAVRGTQLEVAEQPQVEPEPPAEECEPHREHTD